MRTIEITCDALASIRETWHLHVPDDFPVEDPEAVEEAFQNADRTPGAYLYHIADETLDEHDRTVQRCEVLV